MAVKAKRQAPAAEETPLLRADAAGIVTLTLNRPEARNPLSEAMLDALATELDVIADDKRVRAVIIAATGPAFSAGHDLKEMTARFADADGGRAYYADIMGHCSAMMQKIVKLPQPVIAAVEGVASAAGCQLVATCDLAVAGADARFATPGVDIGLFCSTPMVALSRNVAPKHAMEMLLTGEMMSAEEAFRIGLVNRVVPRGGALGGARQLAATIAAKSAMIVKIGKRAYHAQQNLSLADAYEHCSRVMVENMLTHDAREGIGAFVEKRTPKWEDR